MGYELLREDFAKRAKEASEARKKLKKLSELEDKYKHNIIVYYDDYRSKRLGFINKVDFENGKFQIQLLNGTTNTTYVSIDNTDRYVIIHKDELYKEI